MTNGTILAAPGCTFSATNATCSLGAFPAFGGSKLTITVQAPNQPGTMTLAATVSSATTDVNSANNSGSRTTAISALSDLAITKVLNGSIIAGTNGTYTITIQNLGPSDATGVSVADPTPPGLTFVSNSGACTSVFPCNFPVLPAGSTTTIVSTYSDSSGDVGFIGNTATVASATPDPNHRNNSSTAAATIATSADVAIAKHAPPKFTSGGSITYHLDVTNYGPSDALNVVVTDPTPYGLTFVSLTGGGCSAFPCNIDRLTPGQMETLTATYKIAQNLSGTINNTATVSSTTPDPNGNNNSAHAFSTAGPPPSPQPSCPATLDAPIPAVVAAARFGEIYDVQWPAVDGATQYQIDEAADASFTAPFSQTVTTTDVRFVHDAAPSAQTFYYRVRAFAACSQQFSAYSQTVHVVIAPPPLVKHRAVKR